MKIFKYLPIFFLPLLAQGGVKQLDQWQKQGRFDLIAESLYADKFYFSAAQFALKHIQANPKLDPKFQLFMERLMSKSGDQLLDYMRPEDVAKLDITTVRVKKANDEFLLGQYPEAIEALGEINTQHYLYAESQYLLGNALNKLGQFEKADIAFSQCVEFAGTGESYYKGEEKKRYYSKLSDNCQINRARLFYKKGDFERAIKEYDEIEKKAYQWPYILLDRAWANYKLENYNRSLGILVTYDSPLMESYFLPEAEVLKALSYFRMCLYDDALDIIDKYYKKYRNRSLQLQKIIGPKKNDNEFFFQFLSKSIQAKASGDNVFIKNLMTRISKKESYQRKLRDYLNIVTEIKALKIYKESSFARDLIKELNNYRGFLKTSMNHYIRSFMFDFVNEIHSLSYELFNIQLEIITRKKDLIYENKKLVASDRSRGSLQNVNRKVNQFFWSFEGAFWADELGDYSFGLDSQCKKVSAPTAQGGE